MPEITHKKLAELQEAKRTLDWMRGGFLSRDYERLKKQNQRRGNIILLLACSLMSAAGVIIFLNF